MSTEDMLIATLETYGVPVRRQGSLLKDEAYPPTFITWWNYEEIEHSSYDNNILSSENSYDVNVYSADPDRAYALLRQARDDLRAAGWIITDRGHDMTSDEETHIGRGISVVYLSNERGA